MKRRKAAKSAETLTHGGAKRRNAPMAEARPPMADDDKAPVRRAYARRNRNLDPRPFRRGGGCGRR